MAHAQGVCQQSQHSNHSYKERKENYVTNLGIYRIAKYGLVNWIRKHRHLDADKLLPWDDVPAGKAKKSTVNKKL